MYRVNKTMAGEAYGVIRLADGWFIPPAEDNTDYQAYLKWLEEGNTPLPAEENT